MIVDAFQSTLEKGLQKEGEVVVSHLDLELSADFPAYE
jgi:hypothetical protein